MALAYIYTRVSTKDQAVDGTSLETQAKACLDYAAAAGLTLAPDSNAGRPGVFVDGGVSAYKKRFIERNAGKMIASKMRPGNHIIMHTLDRGFRSVYDFSKQVNFWASKNITVHLVTENIRLDTANGRLLANIISSIAQWKSELLSERVRESQAMKKNDPDYVPGRKRSRNNLVLPPAEAAILNRIKPAPPEPPKIYGRVIAYARVSTADQDPEIQHAHLTRYSQHLAESNPELSFVGVYDDHGQSAYRLRFHERKTGGMLDNLLEDGDHLVVVRPDRIFRSLVDMGTKLEEWKARGVVLHFAESGLRTDDPMTQPLIDILVMVAQWESRDIGRRAGLGYRAAQAMGKYMRGEKNCHKWLVVEHDEDGEKLVYPNVPVIMELWHIQLMRKHGMSWEQISDYMERVDATRECRPELPRSGAERSWIVRKYLGHPSTGRRGYMLRKWLRELPQKGMIQRRCSVAALQTCNKRSTPVMWEYLNARSAGSAMWRRGSRTPLETH